MRGYPIFLWCFSLLLLSEAAWTAEVQKPQMLKQAYEAKLAASKRTWESPAPIQRFAWAEKQIENAYKIEDLKPLEDLQLRVFRLDNITECIDLDLKTFQKITYQWPDKPQTGTISVSDVKWLLPLLRSKKEYQDLETETEFPNMNRYKVYPAYYAVESNIAGNHLLRVRMHPTEWVLLKILAIAFPKDTLIQNRVEH